ncbi:hypothetical protein GBA52_008304 [Prunus armeniaca]|nr:hypothetical protein GBA52_008304 [Prunus armeniaca]
MLSQKRRPRCFLKKVAKLFSSKAIGHILEKLAKQSFCKNVGMRRIFSLLTLAPFS